MNCTQCGMELAAHARFCPNCGTPVIMPAPAAPQGTEDSPPVVPPLAPTQPFTQPQAAPWEATRPVSPASQAPLSPPDMPPTLPYYQVNQRKAGAHMLPATVNPTPVSRRARRRGCCAGRLIGGCLVILVILILIAAAGWIFSLRPYLRNLAMARLDQAMSSASDQIPPQAALLPSGPVVIQQQAIQNMIALNLAPSDPIKNPTALITPAGVRLNFQLYTLPCSISTVPAAINGQLTATQVTISGPISLILSPDDLATLLNKHLAEAQARLRHRITSVTLQQSQMTLHLG